MMNERMIGFGVMRESGKAIMRDIPITNNSLDTMYEFIGCRCVDVREVLINGIVFDMWFDDEFLLSAHPGYSQVIIFPYDEIIGNVIFAKHDEEGNTTGVTIEEVEMIVEWLMNGRVKLAKDIPQLL